jgi:aspartate kinase
LNADRVEIFTDVPGIMTADPAVVKSAQLIKTADYQEVLALAQRGAKVIHPLALSIAATAQIPLSVSSSQEPGPGTAISAIAPARPVTGIASHSEITYFRVSNNIASTEPVDLEFFHELAAAEISVHFIDLRPLEVAFVVQSTLSQRVEEILSIFDLRCEAGSDYAKVSVVGVGMTGRPGMISTIIHTLSDRGIAILQSTDSPTSISCLVLKEAEEQALNALHDAFGLDRRTTCG